MPSLVLLAVLVAASEAWLRHRYGKIEAITGVTEWTTATFGDLTYYWDAYHPLYGWTNRAGYQSDERVPFKVTINGQGLRGDRDYAPAPDPGTYRVAVFGDSCTFGEDVDDDQTLPVYLERHLGGAEVLNFGVHGYGLGQMVLRMENEAFAYAPDLVLFVLTSPSDFGRTVLDAFVHPKPAFGLEAGQLAVHNSPVPTQASQPFWLRHSFFAAWLFGRPTKAESRDQDAPVVSRLLLERAKAACDARGVPMAIVTIAGPDWVRMMAQDASYGWIVGSTREITGVGVPVSDQIEALRRIAQAGPAVVAATGAHWSGQGNCLLAARVAADMATWDPSAVRAPTAPDCASAVRAAGSPD